ncbi:unnamed protein product [Owenia fusiformis]|uniref:G-protein coupled receptors family 1 profile domain-containing protein n=1 Tax=Owenia fusiformis TaxID=6347 RepID=A0A8S4P0H6_OWEFU|nr:unnamed protein product [Owenia fusiformis]
MNITPIVAPGSKADDGSEGIGRLTTIADDTVPDIIENVIAEALWKYISPLLILFGTIGNALSIAVLLQKRCRKSTTSLYLSCLAVSDILAIDIGLSRIWINNVFHMDIRNLHDVVCRLHFFIVYFLPQASSWILVMFTTERTLAVWLPHKVSVISSKRTAAIMISLTMTILAGFNMTLFWTQILVEEDGKYYCQTHPDHIYFDYQVWPWIDSFLASFIPFTIIAICNLMIVFKLQVAKRLQQSMNTGNGRTTADQKMSSATVILIFISIMFLTLTSPLVLYLYFYQVWYPYDPPVDEHVAAQSELHYTITYLMYFTNHACNFILYVVSSAKFRADLKNLLVRRGRSNERGNITGTSGSTGGPTRSVMETQLSVSTKF